MKVPKVMHDFFPMADVGVSGVRSDLTSLPLYQVRYRQMDWLKSPNLKDDFRCRSLFLIGIGLCVWTAIGASIGHTLWLNRENYTQERFWTMVLLYVLFCPVFLYGGLHSFRHVHEQLMHNVQPAIASWVMWGVLQYTLLLLFASVYVNQSTYDDIVTILLTLLSPQLVVYMRCRVVFLIMFFADIPFVLLVAHDSPFALGVCLMLLHTLIMGFVKESIHAQKSTLALRDANHQLRIAQLQLADSAKQSERLRIARDLHDKVGHHLVALNIQLEVAGLMAEGEVKDEVGKSQQISKALLQDVRSVVSEMRHQPVQRVDERIHSLIENTQLVVPHIDLKFLVKRQFFNDATSVKMEPELEDILVLSAHELLTNTLKHGAPTEITVVLKQTEQFVSLCVTDNGRADQSMPSLVMSPQWGNGLTGIMERLSAIRGTLTTVFNATGLEATIEVGTACVDVGAVCDAVGEVS